MLVLVNKIFKTFHHFQNKYEKRLIMLRKQESKRNLGGRKRKTNKRKDQLNERERDKREEEELKFKEGLFLIFCLEAFTAFSILNVKGETTCQTMEDTLTQWMETKKLTFRFIYERLKKWILFVFSFCSCFINDTCLFGKKEVYK